MFSNISWIDYLAAVGCLLTAYYLISGICYYSHDLQKRISNKKKKVTYASPIDLPEISNDDTIPSNEDIKQPNQEDTFNPEVNDTVQEVEQLITQIKEMITETNQTKYNREEFLLSLQILFEEHPALKDSPHQSAINELVVSECEKNGAITLSEEEIVKLWNEQS